VVSEVAKVSSGVARTRPRVSKYGAWMIPLDTRLVSCWRVRLMPFTIFARVLRLVEAGSNRFEETCSRKSSCSTPVLLVGMRTLTPLRTAAHAARLAWLTESRPRAALSLGAAVKRSARAQSLVGWVPRLPAQRYQEVCVVVFVSAMSALR